MNAPSRSVGNRLLVPASALIALCAFVHACGGGGGGGGGNPPAPSPGPGPTGFVSTFQFPANSATNVPRQPQILIGFNDTVNPATMSSTTVSLNQGLTPVPSTLAYLPCNNRIRLIPNAALLPSLVYTVSLTAGLRDDDNEALTAMTFSFTTTAGADIVRPTFTQAGFTAEPSPGTETNQMVLDWTDGDDPPNTAGTISYRVYMSTTGCFDFASPAVVVGPGILQALVPGLTSRTAYSFVVRAVDAEGNESLNEASITATTFTSLASDVFPVVSSQCVGCHQPGGTASNPPYNINMNYSTAQTVFNSWVGQSSQCAGAAGAGYGIRVVGGSPATSFLWNKISTQGGNVVACGDQMPFGLPPMSDANQDVFFDWIDEGALDN